MSTSRSKSCSRPIPIPIWRSSLPNGRLARPSTRGAASVVDLTLDVNPEARAMDAPEFLLQAHIDADVLEAWIEAGWVAPGRDAQALRFSAADVARAQLIHDLKGGMGVNDEGVTIILDLVD